MRLVLLLALLIGQADLKAGTGNDVLLSGYYLGKASLPFFLLPTAIEDGDMVLLTDLGLFATLTAPATGVLYSRWLGDQDKIALWRKINFGVDLALAGGGAAYSIWLMVGSKNDPDGYSGLAGFIGLVASAAYATTCLADLIPFSTETKQVSNLSVQPLFSLATKQTGLTLRYRY